MYNFYQTTYAPHYPPPHPRENDPLLVQLHEAASSGNTEACTALIKRRPQIVNIVRSRVGTALHAATVGGHAETIRRLIWLGANTEITCNECTPLHLAARKGHTMAAKVLLEHNANPEAYHDGEGNPGPLHAACLEGNIQIARCLVQAGADVNRLDWDACRPLHHAARHDDPDLIRLLLHAGANPNVLAYDEHRSPLHKAATVGSLQSVKALITGGADPDGFRVRASCYEQRPEPDHLSPIGFAIINDHVDVVSELVQSNADLTHRMNFRKALSEVINKIPIREFNVKKNKEKLLGKFELNHPVFNGTMKPVKYSVLTEKTKIIGALMMSSQYSNNDVNSLIRLTEIHQLARSRQAINKHSVFIPPESLQVLAGRAVKQNIKKNCPDREISACIQQLTIPENLQHFLQQPIDINKLQN